MNEDKDPGDDERTIVFKLKRSETIVFVDFLMRYSYEQRLAIEHEAEEQLLWDLCAVAENQVVQELLGGKWEDTVDAARTAVIEDGDF